MSKGIYMTLKQATFFAGLVLVFAGSVVSIANPQERSGPTKGVQLTVQYRDANGGLHGAIFTMQAGTADGIKKELLAEGAHTTVPGGSTGPAAAPSGSSTPKERKR